MSNQPEERDRFIKRYTENDVQRIGDWMHGWGGFAVLGVFCVVIVWMFLQPVWSWIIHLF